MAVFKHNSQASTLVQQYHAKQQLWTGMNIIVGKRPNPSDVNTLVDRLGKGTQSKND